MNADFACAWGELLHGRGPAGLRRTARVFAAYSGVPLKEAIDDGTSFGVYFQELHAANTLLLKELWDEADKPAPNKPMDSAMVKRMVELANEAAYDETEVAYYNTVKFVQSLTTVVPAGLYSYAMSEPDPLGAVAAFIAFVLNSQVAVIGTSAAAKADMVTLAKNATAPRAIMNLVKLLQPAELAGDDWRRFAFAMMGAAVRTGDAAVIQAMYLLFPGRAEDQTLDMAAMSLSGPAELAKQVDEILVQTWVADTGQLWHRALKYLGLPRMARQTITDPKTLEFVLQKIGRPNFAGTLDSVSSAIVRGGAAASAAFAWLLQNFSADLVPVYRTNYGALRNALAASDERYADQVASLRADNRDPNKPATEMDMHHMHPASDAHVKKLILSVVAARYMLSRKRLQAVRRVFGGQPAFSVNDFISVLYELRVAPVAPVAVDGLQFMLEAMNQSDRSLRLTDDALKETVAHLLTVGQVPVLRLLAPMAGGWKMARQKACSRSVQKTRLARPCHSFWKERRMPK